MSPMIGFVNSESLNMGSILMSVGWKRKKKRKRRKEGDYLRISGYIRVVHFSDPLIDWQAFRRVSHVIAFFKRLESKTPNLAPNGRQRVEI